MKDENLCIANETVQQLRSFRDWIITLPLNSSRKLYYSNLMKQQQLRIRSELIELDLLKAQLIAKLQQDMLDKNNFAEHSEHNVLQTQKRLMEIYQPLSERLSLGEEAIRIRIIVIIMNFKFNIRQGLQPKLSFQDLLIVVQELNLWQTFAENQQSFLKYFYLCLMWQYLSRQDIQNFMEIDNLYVDYLLKSIQNRQTQNNSTSKEQINELLIDLLHCHHSFKLFKKQYNLDCLLAYQSQVYSVLYQLDYALSEQVIYQYKKLHSKTKQQIVAAIMEKIGRNILQYDEKNVDKECYFQDEIPKSCKYTHFSNPSVIIKNKSSLKIVLPQVTKKRNSDLKPINNIFVPKRMNQNLQLERRLQMKKEIRSIHDKMKSSSNIRKASKKSTFRLTVDRQVRNAERQLTIVRNLGEKTDYIIKSTSLEKPSYESCKKHSINRYQQLQMMVCDRHNKINLKLNSQGEESSLPRTSVDRDRINSNRKRRFPNRKGSINFNPGQANQFKRRSFLETGSSQITIPSVIRLPLAQYIKGFTTYFKYRQIKYTLPLFIYFQGINTTNCFYLKGKIIRFVSISFKGLAAIVVYTKNQKQLITVTFKLYEKDESTVRQLFIEQQKECKLAGFYKLGENLTFYSFKVRVISESSSSRKFQVSNICYQKQIYSYNVYVTSQVKKKHYKTIIAAQQKYIKEVEESLKLNFKYDKQISNCTVQKKQVCDYVNLSDLLHFNIKKSLHEWQTFQSITVSLRITDKYHLFLIKQLQHLQTRRNFLLVQSSNTCKIGSQFKTIPCKKIFVLEKFMKNVYSWHDITKKFKEKNFLVQKSWTDIILNQRLFDMKTRKYVVKKQEGYRIFVSQSLTDKALNLIKGQQGKLKWFIILNLKDFELIPKICEYKTNKTIKQGRRRSINPLSTHISLKSKKMMPSCKQPLEIKHVSPVELIKKEKNKVFLGNQCFKCIEYEYSWYLYVRKKVYYCFKGFRQVFTLAIKDSKFIYFQKYPITQQKQSKQLIFSQFRRLLTLKLAEKIILFSRLGNIGAAQVKENYVIIYFNQNQGKYTVQISSLELYGFDSSKIHFDHSILSSKKMLKRIKQICRYKLAQKLVLHD